MLVKRFRGDVLRYRALKCAAFGSRQLSNRLDALNHEERLEGCLSCLPTKAKVVICGGGVMGAAVAYHLARRGWGNQTILIEREK